MMFDPFANGGKKSVVGRAYISPSQVPMGGIENDQTSMAHYVPGGSFGGKSVGKGTVIPRHRPGRGGGSLGYNPHKPPHRNVIVDPHVPGRAVALDLSKINPENSEAAFAAGMEFAGEVMEDPPEKMDGIEMTIEEGPRLGAYATVRMLAENFGAASADAFSAVSGGARTLQAAPAGGMFGGAPAPPATTGRSRAAAFGQATVGRPAAPVQVVAGGPQGGVTVRAAGPMARFQPSPAQPQPQAPQQPPPPPPARVVDQAQQAAGPPTRKVVFDFGTQVGQFPAAYHDVIRAPQGLILVWDTRWQYGEPYSPEHLANQFAVRIHGDPEDHLVLAVGDTFTFEHNGFRYYHLGIVESMPAE